jgi:2-keto-4-pentenoate hydratase/2-oxohepta-3-ene-1,7-dioic acid hydratase in catechol pathway
MPTSAPVLFDIPESAIPISGEHNAFPVRRIYCVGRNYAAHAREMGADPSKEEPFFFQKPRDAVQYVAPDVVADHPYPALTENYHHEVELVVGIGRGGSRISASDAHRHVYGYAVGLDMTRRDLQKQMQEQKKPWDIGKAFDRSAPIGAMVPAARIGDLARGSIKLSVNGELRQSDDLGSMIWSIPAQIERLSRAFRLEPGDLIFTGTPENVGPVKCGDRLTAEIEGLPSLSIRIV